MDGGGDQVSQVTELPRVAGFKEDKVKLKLGYRSASSSQGKTSTDERL
jgi:hypothetical protein